MVVACKIVGLTTLFTVSLTGGLLLHLNTRPARSVARQVANSLLAPSFKGKLEIGEVRSLWLEHAHIDTVIVRDPDGEVVIHATDVEADVETLALLRGLLFGQGPIRVLIPKARLDVVRTTLRPNADNIPTIADAFLPREAPEPGAPGRPVVVRLPDIDIRELQIDGSVGTPLRGVVRDLRGEVFLRTDRGLAVNVRAPDLAVAELIPIPVEGTLEFGLRADLRDEKTRADAIAAGEHVLPPAMLFATLEGLVGGSPISLSAELEGGFLRAEASLPRIEPATLKQISPLIPLNVSSSAQLSVEGTLPGDLSFDAEVEVLQKDRPAPMTIAGALGVLSEEIRIELHTDFEDFDPRSIVPAAPAGQIAGEANMTLSLAMQGPEHERVRLCAEVATEPTRLLDQAIPAVDAVVHVHRGEVLISATAHEEGMPIMATVSLVNDVVSFSAATTIPELYDAPRLQKFARGKLDLRIDGKLVNGELDANLAANGRAVTLAGSTPVAADRLSLMGRIKGPISKLELDARASGSSLVAAGEVLDRVDVTAKGSVFTPAVTVAVQDRERGRLNADATVSVLEPAIRNIRLRVEREGEVLTGSVGAIELAKGVNVKDVRLGGAVVGKLEGTISMHNGELTGDVHAEGLDLGRTQKLIGLPIDVAGVANIEVHVQQTQRGRAGTIEVEIERGAVSGVQGVSARVSARLAGSKIEGAGFVRLIDHATDEERAALAKNEPNAILCDGPIAELRFANLEGELRGPLMSVDTWTKAIGSADVAGDNWDLGCIERRVRAMRGVTLPLDRLRGLFTTRFHVARKASEAYPSISELQAFTSGLEVVGEKNAWSSKALDVALRGGVAGGTGATDLVLVVFEQANARILTRLETTADLDIAALFRGGPTASKSIRTTPFTAQLTIDARSIDDLGALPAPLADQIPQLEGSIDATLTLSGSLESPRAFASVHVQDLAPASTSLEWVPALDLTLMAAYDPDAGRLDASLGAMTQQGQTVASVTAGVDIAVSALLDPVPNKPLPWRGDLTVKLDSLPLETVPAVNDMGIAGRVSGTLKVTGVHDTPSAEIDLRTDGLTIQGTPFVANVTARVAPPTTTGNYLEPSFVEVSVSGPGQGSLLARGVGAVKWTDALYPILDLEQPGRVYLHAEDFRLAALYPAVSSFLARLDGRVQGDADVYWGKLSQRGGRVERCELAVTGLVAYIPQFGQELHDGSLVITADAPTASGSQTIRVANLVVRGSSGGAKGQLDVTFANGVRFTPPEDKNTRENYAAPWEATGFVQIPEEDAMPITLEGVSLGKATAQVKVGFQPIFDGLQGTIAIDEATFELPPSSSRNVQSMDDAPGVTVVQIQQPKEQRKKGSSQLNLLITVGNTRLRSGKMIDVLLKSEPVIDLRLGDQMEITGDIVLLEGSVVVNKKKFEIDPGSFVRMRREDATNPYVSLTAHWDVTADLRVVVEYRGTLNPITDDKITFRADPPLDQANIVQLLIFGKDAAASDANAATATNLAGTLGGTVISGFANDLLSSLGGGIAQAFSVQLGASEGENLIGGTVAFNDKFSLGGSVRQMQGPTSTNVNGRAGGCQDLYFEWRFADQWSLRGAGGHCDYTDADDNDTGLSVGVDALWQTRY